MPLSETEKLRYCNGCRDDFYNGKNQLGVQRCWGLKTAKLVDRFRIGTWTAPTQPFAFTKVKTLSCFHANGEHYYEKLPDFVKKSEVAGLAK